MAGCEKGRFSYLGGNNPNNKPEETTDLATAPSRFDQRPSVEHVCKALMQQNGIPVAFSNKTRLPKGSVEIYGSSHPDERVPRKKGKKQKLKYNRQRSSYH